MPVFHNLYIPYEYRFLQNRIRELAEMYNPSNSYNTYREDLPYNVVERRHFFDADMKRGSAEKRTESLVEEALGAIKTLSLGPLNQPTSENDSAEDVVPGQAQGGFGTQGRCLQ